MTELENWVSVAEAAEASGYSVQMIRQLARQGLIQAKHIGRPWIVHLPSLLRYKAQMEAAGTSRHDPRRNPEWERSTDAGRKAREDDP
jgi:hypothetical protein